MYGVLEGMFWALRDLTQFNEWAEETNAFGYDDLMEGENYMGNDDNYGLEMH